MTANDIIQRNAKCVRDLLNAAAEIERLQKDNAHWQGIASQGIAIERTLRGENENLKREVECIRTTYEVLMASINDDDGRMEVKPAMMIEGLKASLKTAENTAKINLKVAKDRGAEIERLRAWLGIAFSALRYLEQATGETFDDEGGDIAAIEAELTP